MRAPLTKSPATESAIAVPRGSAGVATDRVRVSSRRTLLITAVLLLFPLFTYWSTTFHAFALRDDYSNLREAHEEMGKIIAFCASDARPIYGWLLESTFSQVTSLQTIQWLRVLAAVLLGALSLASFRGLRALGWTYRSALAFALVLVLTPSSQVIASWAIGWPYALAALLAFAAFFSADGALSTGLRGSPRAAGQLLVALGLMLASALTYQTSTMFYMVPLAAALIVQRRRSATQSVRWMGIHIALVAASLGLAYCLMSAMYAAHLFVRSPRVAFETLWLDKIFWFLQEPLPNALSVFVLNDNNGRDHTAYLACAGLAGLILIAGAVIEWRRHGRARGLVYAAALTGLPTIAFTVSMVAAEHYATYRTILAMTGVLLCFLVSSIGVLIENWTGTARRALVGACLLAGFFMAQHHTFALIATPQGHEWQLIDAGARQVRLDTGRNPPVKPSIFVIASAPADLSTATIYHDEFGSLSSNSEWVPREMFKRAMHDLHPEIANLDSRYEFATGKFLPPNQHFDLIIDLHRLRRYYTDN